MSTPRPLVESSQSEQEQLARIRAGDVRAFEALFLSYYPDLRAFVASYVDRPTGEDVIQELFLALWRRREAWTPLGGVRAYLFAAARNQALNAIRRRKSALSLEEVCAADGSVAGANPLDVMCAQHASTREIQAACRKAIHELPEVTRLVIMLRWDYGMSHAEIAFVLGTTIDAVVAALKRGLDTLAARLYWLRP